jgi:hypothetical protein
MKKGSSTIQNAHHSYYNYYERDSNSNLLFGQFGHRKNGGILILFLSLQYNDEAHQKHDSHIRKHF